MNSIAKPPRSAYVHVPFCAHRCGYCNFTLLAGRDDLAEAYLQAIETELRGLAEPREVDTLFFGGGTPTHLTVDQLDRLLSVVLHWFPLASGYEFSMEANPGDLHQEKLALLKDRGLTRISLGGQSFDADKLRTLERTHTPAQLRAAVVQAKEYIASVSLDLIFAAPGETLAVWQSDLAQASALDPNHISTYGLTFERGTMFWNRRSKGELQQADEELERSMYALALDALASAGYVHYEISNFARPGLRCRHNEAYWAGESYYAVGPGAARYIDFRREMNHRSTTTWIKRVLSGQSPVAESEQLPPEDRAREALVFGLRRLEGVDRRQFAARFGFEVDALVGEPLRRFVSRGLLQDNGVRIRLSREGLFISDSLWPHFLSQ